MLFSKVDLESRGWVTVSSTAKALVARYVLDAGLWVGGWDVEEYGMAGFGFVGVGFGVGVRGGGGGVGPS